METFFLRFIFMAANALAVPSPQSPSQPVSIGDHISYSELSQAYDSGQKTSNSFLLGRWKAIVHIYAADCDFPERGYVNFSGLKDYNGQWSTVADFGYYKSKTLGSSQSVFGVKIHSREEDDGPYRVNTSEPQFAIWAAVDNIPSKDFYWSYNCRTLSASPNRLICAIKMAHTSNEIVVARRCDNHGPDIFSVFEKLP